MAIQIDGIGTALASVLRVGKTHRDDIGLEIIVINLFDVDSWGHSRELLAQTELASSQARLLARELLERADQCDSDNRPITHDREV